MVIGIYDSGLGGLSVWRELRRYTKARLLYFGDTCHVPYGEKTPDQLESYFWDIAGFFQSRGSKGIVVACNTSSAVVLPRVYNKVETPVFGIIESAVRATLADGGHRVGVLATRATVESGAYQEAFKKANPKGQIFAQSAPRLVPLVEQGKVRGPEVEKALEEYLAPLLAQKIDTLVLGCTHYPFLEEQIASLVGPNVNLVDPGPAMALHVLEELPDLAKGPFDSSAETEFWVSGEPGRFKETAECLLQETLPGVGFHEMRGERT